MACLGAGWDPAPGALCKAWPASNACGSGCFQNRREMKPPRIDAVLRELVGLSLIAAGACDLAFSQSNFLFVAIFAAACAMMIIEARRRSQRDGRGATSSEPSVTCPRGACCAWI